MAEKVYEKFAWILVVLEGVIWFIFGINAYFFPSISALPSGQTYSAAVLNTVRMTVQGGGEILLVSSALLIGLGVKAFREGEKWAWYATLSVPAVGFLDMYITYLSGTGPAGLLGIYLIVWGLPLIASILTVRKFFPKKI